MGSFQNESNNSELLVDGKKTGRLTSLGLLLFRKLRQRQFGRFPGEFAVPGRNVLDVAGRSTPGAGVTRFRINPFAIQAGFFGVTFQRRKVEPTAHLCKCAS